MADLRPYQDPTGQLDEVAKLRKDVDALIAASNQQSKPVKGNIQTSPQSIIVANSKGNKVVLGYQQGFQTQGLFVAKDGADAFNSSNTADYIFNSNQNTYKIASKITNYSIPKFNPSNSISSQVSIPHGQTKAPIINAFVSGNLVDANVNVLASSFIPLPIYPFSKIVGAYYFNAEDGNQYPLQITYGVNDTNIIIIAVYYPTGTAPNVNISAVPLAINVLQETAT